MLKFRWASVGATHVLFQMFEGHALPEWQPVAQVTLRQVYEKQGQRWYVWWFKDDAKVEAESFERFDIACDFAENWFKCMGKAGPRPPAIV